MRGRPANKNGHIGGSGKDGGGVRERRGGKVAGGEEGERGTEGDSAQPCRHHAPAVRAGRRRVQADAVAIAAQQDAMARTQLGHRHRISTSTRYVYVFRMIDVASDLSYGYVGSVLLIPTIDSPSL